MRDRRWEQLRELTRSLADFAKLVELFDQHAVSFISGSAARNSRQPTSNPGVEPGRTSREAEHWRKQRRRKAGAVFSPLGRTQHRASPPLSPGRRASGLPFFALLYLDVPSP